MHTVRLVSTAVRDWEAYTCHRVGRLHVACGQAVSVSNITRCMKNSQCEFHINKTSEKRMSSYRSDTGYVKQIPAEIV